jgi:hypothetical protein
MFIMQKEPTWTWPVKVLTPREDGSFNEARFNACFRLLPKEEREALGSTAEGTDALLRKSVVQLLDLVDEAKAPLPHSPELLDACIGNPWIRMALVRSYVQATSGIPISEAAAGN